MLDIETFANATAKSVEEPMAQLGVNNLSTFKKGTYIASATACSFFVLTKISFGSTIATKEMGKEE